MGPRKLLRTRKGVGMQDSFFEEGSTHSYRML